jgi:hypothetical protein
MPNEIVEFAMKGYRVGSGLKPLRLLSYCADILISYYKQILRVSAAFT